MAVGLIGGHARRLAGAALNPGLVPIQRRRTAALIAPAILHNLAILNPAAVAIIRLMAAGLIGALARQLAAGEREQELAPIRRPHLAARIVWAIFHKLVIQLLAILKVLVRQLAAWPRAKCRMALAE